MCFSHILFQLVNSGVISFWLYKSPVLITLKQISRTLWTQQSLVGGAAERLIISSSVWLMLCFLLVHSSSSSPAWLCHNYFGQQRWMWIFESLDTDTQLTSSLVWYHHTSSLISSLKVNLQRRGVSHHENDPSSFNNRHQEYQLWQYNN